MNKKANLNTNLPSSSTTPIFERAKSLAEQANIHPRQVKKKVFSLLAVLAASVVFALVTLIVIRLGWPQSQNAKSLTALVLLMAVTTSVASVFGLFMLLWTAFVISYVRSIEIETDILNLPIEAESMVPADKLADQATSSGQHRLPDGSLVPGTPRPFWSNAAAASIPALITGGLVLLCYFTFGQSSHPSVDWTIYLIAGLPLVLAIYTGLAFYRSNTENYWTNRRDRKYFKLTILLGNFDQAGAVFGGLLLSAVIGVLITYALHTNQYVRQVTSDNRLAYTRAYLEKVAVQSIKEQRVTGEFLEPQPVRQDISVSTTKKPAEQKVVYTAKPQGSDKGFIAEVTANSGSLYLSTDNTLGDVGVKDIETRFVVGIVKDVENGEFILTVSNSTDKQDEQKDIRIKLNDLVVQPTPGSKVVVAMDSQQMEARRIEEINKESRHNGGPASGAMAGNRVRIRPVLHE